MRLLLPLLICLFCNNLCTQNCLPNGITLRDQASLDRFYDRYPTCKEILGYVRIEGDDIVDLSALSKVTSMQSLSIGTKNLSDLSGLENLKKIEDYLSIRGTYDLTSLNGLDSLREIGDRLYIQNNEDLLDIRGLSNLSHIGGDLDIRDNLSLKSLNGLEKIEIIHKRVSLSRNYKLENLSGLDNLSSINKRLDIGGHPELKSLEGLNNLKSIGRYLDIRENPKLINLKGLDDLQVIGEEIKLTDNLGLINYEGLEKLHSVGGAIKKNRCPSLSSLKGMDNLVSVGELSIGGSLLTTIDGLEKLRIVSGNFSIVNSNLQELNGFPNLKKVGGILSIDRNDDLKRINGFQNLDTISGGITIHGNESLNDIRFLNNVYLEDISRFWVSWNPNLQECNLDNFCNLFTKNNINPTIKENGTKCSSIEAVLEDCGNIGNIAYNIFYDQNQDGIKNMNEVNLLNQRLSLNPWERDFFTLSLDTSKYYIPYGDYTATLVEHSIWKTTTPNERDFSVIEKNNSAYIEFPVFPSEIFSDLEISVINPQLLRCGDTATFKVQIRNEGTQFETGTAWLQIDERLPDFSSNADTISTDWQNNIGWHFENLPPSQTIEKEVQIYIPIPPELLPGEILNFLGYFKPIIQDGEPVTPDFAFPSDLVFRCSYDPNDKQVSPFRQMDDPETGDVLNFTLFEEDLTYQIRFQNTGNDTAFNVVIRDTLDFNLNANSLKILSTSHPELLDVAVKEDRFLEFKFIDIHLPDSTTNLDGSNGFVTFKIEAKENLDERTPIQNTASIYFDKNPPIVTNTIESVMVSEFPEMPSPDPNNSLPLLIYPIPTGEVINIKPKERGTNISDAQITIYSLTGKLLFSEKLGADQQIHLPKGLSRTNSGSETGMLILKIETQEGVAVKRIMKL